MWKLASAATTKRIPSSLNNNLFYSINVNNNSNGNNSIGSNGNGSSGSGDSSKKKEKSSASTKSSTTLANHHDKNISLNRIQLPSRRQSVNDITLVGVNNRDINHMTRLLANSGISVSKINNKLLSLQINDTQNIINNSNTDNSINNNSINNNSNINNNNNGSNSLNNVKNSSVSSSSSSSSSSLETASSSSSSYSTSSSSSSLATTTSNSYSEKKNNSRFNSEFDSFRVLGKGGFGIVFQCTNVYDCQEYAVKRIKVNQRIPTKELMEVRAMARLSHPNIVRYFNSWIEEEPINKYSIDHYGESNNKLFQNQDEASISTLSSLESSKNTETIEYITNNSCGKSSFNSSALSSEYSSLKFDENGKKYSLYIQMEFCKYGSLRNLLNENNNIKSIDGGSNNNCISGKILDLNSCREVFRQILVGLKYIHSQGIVHRDLTPDNIFICQSPFTIKIADFGLATTTESLKACENKKGLGTYLYSSNEQEQGENYDSRTDLYSAAVIFFEMLSQFKTTMERSTTLAKLKKTLSVSLANAQLKLQYPKDTDFIDYLIQPFANRPNSNHIPLDNTLDFPPTLERLLEFKNEVMDKERQQFSYY